MARAPFPDRNQNGYPDAFEAQEAQLLAQLSARRKAYMQRYGQAEQQFTSTQGTPDAGEPRDATSEEKMVQGLFR